MGGSPGCGRVDRAGTLLGPGAGMLIAEVVRRVIGKRRSRPLFITVTTGVILGGLLPMMPLLLFGSGLLGLLWPGIYLFLAASTAYTRLAGIQLR